MSGIISLSPQTQSHTGKTICPTAQGVLHAWKAKKTYIDLYSTGYPNCPINRLLVKYVTFVYKPIEAFNCKHKKKHQWIQTVVAITT